MLLLTFDKSLMVILHRVIRWNIYHYLCNNNNKILLEYFLKKLPQDVNEVLLKQQSKHRFNTVCLSSRLRVE